VERLLDQPVEPIVPYPALEDVPDGSDPRWAEWVKPLQIFILQPRTWPELRLWRVDQRDLRAGVLTQILAWLSLQGLAGYRDGAWRAYKPISPP
jgi:hypothetical protein